MFFKKNLLFQGAIFRFHIKLWDWFHFLTFTIIYHKNQPFNVGKYTVCPNGWYYGKNQWGWDPTPKTKRGECLTLHFFASGWIFWISSQHQWQLTSKGWFWGVFTANIWSFKVHKCIKIPTTVALEPVATNPLVGCQAQHLRFSFGWWPTQTGKTRFKQPETEPNHRFLSYVFIVVVCLCLVFNHIISQKLKLNKLYNNHFGSCFEDSWVGEFIQLTTMIKWM